MRAADAFAAAVPLPRAAPLAGSSIKQRTPIAKEKSVEWTRESEVVPDEEFSEWREPLPKFRPLPGLLVWPNLPLLAFWFFNAGLARNATALLAFELTQPPAARSPGFVALAVLVLAFVGGVLLLGLAMVVSFWWRHRRRKVWTSTRRCAHYSDVHDPIFRQYSFMKVALSCGCLRPLQRMSGRWAKPKEDMVEPARTERLLAHRFTIFRPRMSDAQESMTLGLFAKVSGASLLGLSFAWTSFALQATCGVLAGLGPHLDALGFAPLAQLFATAGMPVAWALAAAALHAVRLPPLQLRRRAAVFDANPAAVGLLVAGDATLSDLSLSMAEVAMVQGAAMWLSLLAFFYPVLMKAYDGIFVSIVVNCCRKRFSWAMFCARADRAPRDHPDARAQVLRRRRRFRRDDDRRLRLARSGAKIRSAFNDLKACCWCIAEPVERRYSRWSSRRWSSRVGPESMSDPAVVRRRTGKEDTGEGGEGEGGAAAADDADGGDFGDAGD